MLRQWRAWWVALGCWVGEKFSRALEQVVFWQEGNRKVFLNIRRFFSGSESETGVVQRCCGPFGEVSRNFSILRLGGWLGIRCRHHFSEGERIP